MDYYYKVTPKVQFIYYAMGLLGLGLLFSMFEYTNKVWSGYVAAGIILFLSFKWEKIEI